MLLIAGLGNPGSQYENNRHNIGFMAVDEIQRRHKFSPWAKKFQGFVSDGVVEGQKILLLKPQTYMNLSGQSVGEAMRFYKIPLENLVVIHDELDLVPGKARIKKGGSSGGHNGIKSIDAHCGNDYRRLRLGIGHPGQKELVHNYVLGNFAKVDQEWLDVLLQTLADNVALLATGKDSLLMNKLTVKTAAEKTPFEKPAKTPKAQSHIHQARNASKKPDMPQSGPMADMLKKLFGKKD